MTNTRRTKASKARKGTTNETRIRAALHLAINAARWSGTCEAITAQAQDPRAPIDEPPNAAAKQFERKAWEYLATIPGEVGDAARRELDAQSQEHGKTLH